jgi:ATP-dependent protease ClpP protease subunit
MPKKKTRSPYEIKALANGDAAEIYIYGEIGESFWDDESVGAAQFVREINAANASEITVRINSYGGSVADGIAIYNAIQRHPATVTVEIDGVAMSSASLIAMAGDAVNMAENALFMVHAPMSGGWGNAKDLREAADMLDKYAEAMISSYVSQTGQSYEEIETLLKDGEDHYYTAQEALEFGFISAISEPVKIAASGIPSGRFNPPAAWVAANKPKGKTPMSERKKSAAKKPAAKPVSAEPAVDNTPSEPVVAASLASQSPTTEQVLAAEKARRESIRASFKPFAQQQGVQAVMDECLDDPQITAHQANQKILAHLGSKAEPLAGSGNIQVGATDREKFVQGASKAILARAGVEKHESSNEFRGMTLMDVARASLEMGGDNRRGMDKRDLVAAAFTQSTSDFPVLLENVMHKALLAAYAETPDTWSRFCKRGEVSDFRAHKRLRVGSFGNLDGLTELGEFKNKSIPDGESESITASTKGNIVNISRQAIINDDLDAFVGIGQNLARSGKRTIESDVYALLSSNPPLSDTVALFHASHSNLAGSGAALSVATLDAGRVAMGSQTGIGDAAAILDLSPKILVCSKSAGGNARVLVNAVYDPDTANKLQKPNMVNGIVDDVVDSARISGTEWYLFADPMIAPVIEVAFLDGVDEPFLDVKEGWGVDGAQYKVRLDYAVGAIDYRGAWKNAGP